MCGISGSSVCSTVVRIHIQGKGGKGGGGHKAVTQGRGGGVGKVGIERRKGRVGRRRCYLISWSKRGKNRRGGAQKKKEGGRTRDEVKEKRGGIVTFEFLMHS